MTTESMYQEIGIRPEVLKFGTKDRKIPERAVSTALMRLLSTIS